LGNYTVYGVIRVGAVKGVIYARDELVYARRWND